jgi:hypothetical protein
LTKTFSALLNYLVHNDSHLQVEIASEAIAGASHPGAQLKQGRALAAANIKHNWQEFSARSETESLADLSASAAGAYTKEKSASGNENEKTIGRIGFKADAKQGEI